MAEVVLAVPGDLSAPTGGYAYDRRLIDLLPLHGITVRHLALPGSFPHPGAADLAWTARRLGEVPPGAVVLIDGLAYGAMPADLIRSVRAAIVALVHHPLGLETGLGEARRSALLASERAALGLARRVIVTSRATRRLLVAQFGVPEQVVAVAEPGTDPAPRATGTGTPPAILAVGAVSPRKGYDVLVRALAGLTGVPWRLTIAGALDRAPAAVAALEAGIRAATLSDRIVLAGAVDDHALDALYGAADLFVSPSRYEGYGMVLAEAMARGLAIVAATGGAAAETLPDGAGLKVPPGDVPSLRGALRRVLAEPALRQALSDAAWAAGRTLPRWSDTAARVAKVIEEAAR